MRDTLVRGAGVAVDREQAGRPLAGRWAGRALRLGLVAPVLLVVALLSGRFVVAAVQALDVAWPITYPEGAHIAAVLRVREGEPLYRDFRQFPHLVTPYPPVVYVVDGLLSRALDLALPATIAAARGVTLLASLTAVALVYALARAGGAGRPAALAGAGMLLPLPFLDKWGYAVRPDLPAVALGLLAALLLLRRPDRAWPAAAVAALAFFTKQTMVALPVAAVVWLWWQGRRAEAGRFAGVWLGLVLGGFLLLHLATEGRHELNVVLAHLNPTNGIEVTLRGFWPLPRQAWLPLGLAGVALALGVRQDRRLGLLGCYWLAALGVALFTLRGRGSDVNYLIEPAAVACALAGSAIDAIWRRGARFGPAGAALLAGAAVAWGATIWPYWRDRGGVDPNQRLPLEQVARAGSVLAEEPTALLLTGQPVLVSDPFHLSMLTSAGRFDPADLVQRIKRGEFDLIVLHGDVRQTRFAKRQPLWPEAVRQAMKDNYIPAGRVGIFWLYAPDR